MRIVLDAAHGGTDSGAVDQKGTTLEKERVLALCNKIKQLAADYNIDAILTRADDKTMSGDERLAVANAPNADLFLSLHIRKYIPEDTTTNNFEAIVTPSNPKYCESKKLASSIMASLSQGGLQTLYTERDVYVLRNNQHPAVTMECGNVDNGRNKAMLMDERQMEDFCRSILSGIVAYSNAP